MDAINTAVVDSLKVLDLKRPIREADIGALGTLRCDGVNAAFGFDNMVTAVGDLPQPGQGLA